MNSCCLKFRHTWMASSVIRWEQWRCTIKYCDICGTRFITDWCELQKEVPIGAKLGWAMKEGVVGIWQTALPLSAIHLLHFHILSSLKPSVFSVPTLPWTCHTCPSNVDTLLNRARRGAYFYLASSISKMSFCSYPSSFAPIHTFSKASPTAICKIYDMW